VALGFVQTTLTNFERAEVNASPRRFVYEEHSFTPQTYDALGFGPLSITTLSNLAQRRAIKFLRSRRKEAVGGQFSLHDFYFPYDEEDLKLLFITRSLPRLRIDRGAYRAIFSADLTDHFGAQAAAVVDAGLAILDDKSLALTPRGMFFADSVAGLFASRRAAEVRSMGAGIHTQDVLHEAASFAMG
jgi:coproporphyrinogen III oxidase-like Fe-S oxidoreductase